MINQIAVICLIAAVAKVNCFSAVFIKQSVIQSNRAVHLRHDMVRPSSKYSCDCIVAKQSKVSTHASAKATSYDLGTAQKNIAIHVTKSVETSLRKRHPWVFENDIKKISHVGNAGDVAVVFDSNNAFLAAGLFDPHGPIRVRILQHKQPRRINSELIHDLVSASLKQRIGVIPSGTNGYRLINGDNDGLPGVIVDLYSDTVVMKVYSACWSPPWLADLEAALAAHAPPHERRVLLLSRHLQGLEPGVLRGMVHGSVLHGPPLDGAVVFEECGLLFEADPIRGQKTGFFLDQRDNRRRVESISRGARVLNVFSYTGGFSLYAARGGAATVTSVDISQPALDAAERNFALNRPIHAALRRARHTTIAGDAFAVMRRLAEEGKRFSVVIVDPPSMANKADQRHLAITRYRDLAGLAVRLVEPGGRVVLASCSSRVATHEFFQAAADGARDAGRQLERVDFTGHAVDHPVRFREGSYLKCLFATVP